MLTLSLELRVVMEHGDCEQTVLGGLVDEARCACGFACTVSAARWSRALAAPLARALDDTDDDWHWADDDEGDDCTLGIAYQWRAPSCAACGAPLHDLACTCGAVVSTRPLPDAIETPELPRPALLVGEAPGRDACWLVVRLPDAMAWAGKDVWRNLHGVAADRSGAIVIIWTDRDRNHVAKLGGDGGLRWRVDSLTFTDHAYLLGAGDEVAIVDPRGNTMQLVDTRDGTLVRTLAGVAPEHEKRDERDFRRREPQSIDVYYVTQMMGIGPDGTISIVRDWYDGIPKSLRRFDREGRPLAPWRRRPGFLARMFAPDSDAPTWQRAQDRPLEVSGWTDVFGVARDGSLLSAGREDDRWWMVRWRADGRLAGATQLPEWLGAVEAIAGDGEGTPILLCDREGDPRQRVIARWESGGLRVLGGPWSNNEEHLHVCDDGAIVIAGRGDSLRVLEPDGRVRWRSRACVRADRARG